MLKLCLSALGGGLLGVIVVPVIAFFGSLALFHALEPQCGTPGDSGGCAMGAGLIGVGAALPGFVIGAVAGVLRERKSRRASGSAGDLDAVPPSAGDRPA